MKSKGFCLKSIRMCFNTILNQSGSLSLHLIPQFSDFDKFAYFRGFSYEIDFVIFEHENKLVCKF
ncbi:hypothetical protein Sjap_012523 [Stephania japonica]|uniref:Uncharacterized protein n=1 Tax=Stephania japonica TaxID=461633 RepID=A0AAP0P0F6_9MAGN